MAPSGGNASPPRAGIVTVSYGSQAVLPAFFGSVAAASRVTVPMVVADNRPDDDEVRALVESAGAQYLAMPSNLGYGAAVNAAAGALPRSVEWVLISNPDVELSPGSLDRLVELGDSDSTVASVGPATFNADGTLYPSAREIPSLGMGIGHALFFGIWPSNPWSRRYRNDTEPATEPRDVGWLSGSCLLVRRSAFDELGGFDPGYFMYFEDVDLGYRFARLGYRNRFEPSVRVTHTGAHSTTTESAKMIATHHASARRFLATKYSGPWRWPLRAGLGAALSIRSSLLTRRARKQGH